MRLTSFAVALLCPWITLAGEATEGEKAGGDDEGDGGIPLEKLLKYNEREIFGGTLTLQDGDRFEVLFDRAGQMAKGFEAQGAPIVDADHPDAQGANRRFIEKQGEKGAKGGGKPGGKAGGKKDEEDKTIAGLAALGLAAQGKPSVWTSRFPVGGDVKVSFNFRIPNLLSRQSAFNVRLNMDRGSFLEAEWFTTIAKRANGKTLGTKVSAHPQYKPVITDWFPKKETEGIGIELAVEGQKFISRIKGTEVAVLDKGKDVTKGKVAFVFSRVAFTIQSLKISGTLDRAWCEKQVAELEKKGKLVRKAPEPPPPPPGPPGAGPGPGPEEGPGPGPAPGDEPQPKDAGKKDGTKEGKKEGKKEGDDPGEL